MKKQILLGLVLLCSFGAAIQAQTIYGSISGAVSDQSGAVVPEAKVTATSTATGLTRDGVANEEGRYRISGLPQCAACNRGRTNRAGTDRLSGTQPLYSALSLLCVSAVFVCLRSFETEAGFERRKKIFAKQAPSQLTWDLPLLKDEDHGSVVLRSHYHGWRKTFVDWQRPTAQVPNLAAVAKR